MTSSMYGLLSKAPYGVYAVDMSQTILFWNRSAEWILGHTAEEAVGLRCYEVLQSLETGQIAGELNLSSYTVLNHIRNASRKLHSQNRLGTILAALRLRLI